MSKQPTKITLGEVLILHTVLDRLKGFTSSEFNYFVAKNLDLAANELKSYFKVVEGVNTIIEPYNTDKQKALEEHCNKNELKEPIVTRLPDGSIKYDIKGNETAYSSALSLLKDKHKTSLDKYEKELKESDKLLLKPTNFTPYKMRRTLVPDNVPTEIYKIIFPYLD